MKRRIKDKKWFPYTVAACVAVLLYVVLTRLGVVLGAVKGFLGHFTTVLIGCVIAYLMNPLAMLYERTVWKRMRREKLRWTVSVVLCLITLLLFTGFLLGTLVPQLAESIVTLAGNMDEYVNSLSAWTEKMGLSGVLNLDELIGTSGSVLNTVGTYLIDNVSRIVNASAQAGKGVAQWVVALILSVYLLLSKRSLKEGTELLLQAALPEQRYQIVSTFFSHCHRILTHYITYTLLDAVIIGVANMLLMVCFGMQYTGLISLVVAVTNLVPTFGPLIGGAIGGFILLLVNPLHALIFIIFTVVLQFLDAYFIKPKLFGDSLGVSGLLILIAVIVCGSMFGVIGILLAIPLAAILQFVYIDELLPLVRKRAESNQTPPPEKES